MALGKPSRHSDLALRHLQSLRVRCGFVRRSANLAPRRVARNLPLPHPPCDSVAAGASPTEAGFLCLAVLLLVLSPDPCYLVAAAVHLQKAELGHAPRGNERDDLVDS